MKATHDSWNSKIPKVKINPKLDKYQDMDLFPDKLAQAKEKLQDAKLPPRRIPV